MLYIGVFLLLVLNLAGLVLIKFSPQYYHNIFLLGFLVVSLVGIYALRSVIWLILGERYQLSFVYPILGINYVLSLFVGMAVFHEPFVWRRIAGAVIILSGVTLLSLSKHRNDARSAVFPI
jgi:drug/metabolite transporter (DMT)-like permease